MQTANWERDGSPPACEVLAATYADAGEALLDPAVPSPAQVLGFDIGSRAARHDELLAYLEALADSADCARLFEYGRTHRGRRLVHLTFGDPERLEHLEDVLARLAALGDPRRDDPIDAAELPASVWVGSGLHGNEPTGGDAALVVAHRLAAGLDEATRKLRERLLVHIDPAANPDGRECYLAQTDLLSGKVASLDPHDLAQQGTWPSGRGNHYMFDLNRDLLAQTQPETVARTRTLLRLLPQLVLALHEMGSDDTFLFASPADPLNPHLPPRVRDWWRRLGAAQARALDRLGRSYYTGEWNETFFPGYEDIWPAYSGAVPVLFEQAFTGPRGIRRPDGRLTSYLDAVVAQAVGVVANLEAAADGSAQLLADWAASRAETATALPADGTRAYLIPAQPDGSGHRRLADSLVAQGVEVQECLEEVDALPAGSLLIRCDQPAAALVRTVLDQHTPMPPDFLEAERRELEASGQSRLYDVTAWSLPLAHDVTVRRASEIPSGSWRRREGRVEERGGGLLGEASFGYLYRDDELHLTTRLLAEGIRPRVAREPFLHQGVHWPAGTILLRREDNGARLEEAIDALGRRHGVAIAPAQTAKSAAGPDLGGGRFTALERAPIAIVAGDGIAEAGLGAVRHAIDMKAEVPASLVAPGRLDLKPYGVLVLPECDSDVGHSAVVGERAARRLRAWVESGGTLIALGNACPFVGRGGLELSGIAARADCVADHPQEVWAPESCPPPPFLAATGTRAGATSGSDAPPPVPPFDLDSRRATLDEVFPHVGAATADEYLRRFMPSGAYLAADLQEHHLLGSGLGPSMPVLFRADDALLASPPTAVVARLAPLARLHLAGLLWPEAALRLAETAYLTCERVGHGQVIAFASDPVWRGSTPATERLFMRALAFGPALLRA